MPYNPCGRKVDWARRPYTTQCRFFKDDPTKLTKIVWYPALPTAKPLGFASCIFNKYNEDDHYANLDIGEVWGEKRPPNKEVEKPMTGGAHYCGTEADFRDGATYDPDIPPVVYTDNELPTCCPQAVKGKGGIGLGGMATPSIRPLPRMEGGVALGGKATPYKGIGCSAALPLTFGVVNHISLPPGFGQAWFYFDTLSGTQYKIRVSNGVNVGVMVVTRGVSCGINPAVPFFMGCGGFTASSTGKCWVRIDLNFTLPITVDVEPLIGTCP